MKLKICCKRDIPIFNKVIEYDRRCKHDLSICEESLTISLDLSIISILSYFAVSITSLNSLGIVNKLVKKIWIM